MTDTPFEYTELLAEGGHFAEPYPDDLDWNDPDGLGAWEDQVHHRFVLQRGNVFEYLHYAVSNNHVEYEVWWGTYRFEGDLLRFERAQRWSWVSGKWMEPQTHAEFDPNRATFSVRITRDAVGLRFDLDECTFRPLRDCPHLEPMHDDVRLRIDECRARVRSHLGL